MSETRKLAAILCSDVVGYSRLAGADEDRILARLRALRSDLIDPTIAVHKGRIVKRTGDGSIVEFRSVVDAVRCAIEVQGAMVERNAGVPEDRRIVFRIGIHLGDIVEEADGDLMGDGVNIAARLESVCEPGGVCLSDDAYRQVRDKLNVEFADIGEKQLKNIARPVRAYALTPAAFGAPQASKPAGPPPTRGRVFMIQTGLAAALALVLLGGSWLGWRIWSPAMGPAATVAAVNDKLATAPRLSIVVLPFENLSADPEQQFFTDGITDDLTTDLSHLPESFVIARNTAFTYKGKPVDVKEIGRELGVRYALEGSVRPVGENITINAQLISTETGAHVWADRFDGERSRLGALQVEFVARLANSLNVELIKAESLRALRERPNNPDAVDLAMRGWAAYYQGPAEVNRNAAIEDFEGALRIDSGLQKALVGLSLVLSKEVIEYQSADPSRDIERADALAAQALSAHPDDAQAHFAKSYSLYAKKQFEAAIAEANAAIADDRNLAGAYANAGFWKVFLGHADDGFPGVETALRLSPRDPQRYVWEYQMCHLHTHLAHWDQTIEWCRKSVTSNPYFLSFLDLAVAYAWTGRDADAKAAVADFLKMKPGYTMKNFAAYAKWTDNPIWQLQYQRMVDGLRKAGLPEQ